MIARSTICGIIGVGLVLMLLANVSSAQDEVKFSVELVDVTPELVKATPEPTNTPPPPDDPPPTVLPGIRPTRPPGTPLPPREYPATLNVRCWHHDSRTICIAVVVTNDEGVVLALITERWRSYSAEITNYFPFTVEVTWFDVKCGDWLGKFELKALDAFGIETPDRSVETIKNCVFIPEVTNGK